MASAATCAQNTLKTAYTVQEKFDFHNFYTPPKKLALCIRHYDEQC